MRPLLLNDRDLKTGGPTQHATFLHGIGKAIAIVLATRLVVWIAAYCGGIMHVRIVASIDPPLSHQMSELQERLAGPESELAQLSRRHVAEFAPLLNWDAGHYRSVIERGYTFSPAGSETPQEQAQSNIAFFPLYPLLCRGLAPLTGVAGSQVLVANLAALLAGILLYVWVRQRADVKVALFAVACAFCWPAACFYSFGFAEGLMLLLFVVTLWALESHRFLVAGIASGLATATRPTAIGMVLIVALVYWLQSGRGGKGRWTGALTLGLLASGGLVLYAGYLTYRFGSPLVYLENFRGGWYPSDEGVDWVALVSFARIWDQFKYFGRAVAGFPAGLVILANPLTWTVPATLAVLFLSLAGMTRVPRSFRPLLLLGPLIFLQSYLAAGWTNFGVEALGRYTAVAAPAFVVLGAWCAREWSTTGRTVLISTLLLLQASWAFHFGLCEWTG